MRIMLSRVTTWARSRLSAFRASLVSISDPRIARLFGWGVDSRAGVEVTEASVLGLSAVYRALDLISGTLGQLPMRTLREVGPRRTQQMRSFLDNPGGVVGLNPVVWKRLVFVHASLYNEVYLKKIFNFGGALIGLQPIHPQAVTVTLARADDAVQPDGGKWFDCTMPDGTRERHDTSTMVQVLLMTFDGVRGVWISAIGRDSFGTAIAGERSAATMLSSGGSVQGVVTPKDDTVLWSDSSKVKTDVNNALTGWDNAGGIGVLNVPINFTQMSLSPVDLQMLESRQFSIEEIARWFGVPPFELMQTEKQTSWGTGIESQQRGLGRQLLAPKASCLEAELSLLLASVLFVRFDFAELERPSPDRVADQARDAWNDDLITRNEARGALGYDAVPSGDVFKSDVSRETPALEPVPDPAPEAVPGA